MFPADVCPWRRQSQKAFLRYYSSGQSKSNLSQGSSLPPRSLTQPVTVRDHDPILHAVPSSSCDSCYGIALWLCTNFKFFLFTASAMHVSIYPPEESLWIPSLLSKNVKIPSGFLLCISPLFAACNNYERFKILNSENRQIYSSYVVPVIF